MYYLWFYVSRWVTYMTMAGIWIFSGLATIDDRYQLPDWMFLAFLFVETPLLVYLAFVYSKYNFHVLRRRGVRAVRGLTEDVVSDWKSR